MTSNPSYMGCLPQNSSDLCYFSPKSGLAYEAESSTSSSRWNAGYGLYQGRWAGRPVVCLTDWQSMCTSRSMLLDSHHSICDTLDVRVLHFLHGPDKPSTPSARLRRSHSCANPSRTHLEPFFVLLWFGVMTIARILPKRDSSYPIFSPVSC